MKFIHPFHQKNQLSKTLFKAVTLCVLTSLLAGLLPPSLGTALPLLSTAKAAQATADRPHLEEQPPFVEDAAPTLPERTQPINDVEAVTAAPVAAPNTSPFAQGGPASISGLVYRDFDADGIKDTGDVGVGGVTVTAYAASGAAIASTTASTTTATLGQYTLSNLPASTPLRLEFTTLPTGYKPGPQGTANGTSVQFVTTTSGALSNINFGVNNPADYGQTNPTLVTSVYINGATTGTGNANTLARWSYANTGTSPAPTQLASKLQIGSTYGLAYARTSKVLYVGSFVKRHVGVGPNGIGAIYQVPNANAATPGAPSLFVDLAALGIDVGGGASANSSGFPSNATRGLANATDLSADATVFDYPGKRGLGDVDIADNEQTLFTVNLFNQSLLAIPMVNPTAANIVSTPIPDPGCVGGSTRPFGLKYYRSKLYIGVVCDASVSLNLADLKAVVYRYDPANTAAGFTSVLTMPLNYTKGYAEYQYASCYTTASRWNPWSDTYSPCYYNPGSNWDSFLQPEPILADIEFDLDGSMILGFRDRLGDQVGAVNTPPVTSTHRETVITGGDILRAAPNADGTYTVESNGTVASGTGGTLSSAHTTTHATAQGPDGREFYNDNWDPLLIEEFVSGGLALLPGSGEVVVTAFDAAGVYFEGNTVKLSNTNGAQRSAYQVFVGRNNNFGYFGKANGLGDLEILLDPAPIEIGNRVWNDANHNGLQDAGELPIAGVVLGLYSGAGVLIDTVTTDSNGTYAFSSATGTDVTGRNYGVNLQPNTSYTVAVYSSNLATGGTLAAYTPTTANSTGNSSNQDADGATPDTIDSDGVTVTVGTGANAATIGQPFTTGAAGSNNHSFDFGFYAPVSIGNQVWYDTNNDSTINTGELGVDGVTVNLFLDANANGTLDPAEQTAVVTQTTSNGGYYLFTHDSSNNALSAGQYFVGIAPSNFATGGVLAGSRSSGSTISTAGVIADATTAATTNTNGDNADDGLSQTSGFYNGGVLSGVLVVTIRGEPTNEATFGQTAGTTPGHPNTINGTASGIAIADNNSNLTVDFGFYRQTLGNLVFLDANNNGKYDSGEAPIAGATVNLFAQNGTAELLVGPDGILGTSDDVGGGVTTGTDGAYLFQNLPAGSYIVKVTPPANYYSSTDIASSASPNNNVDNDDNGIGANAGTASSAAVTLTPGSAGTTSANTVTAASGTTANPTVDFGFYASTITVVKQTIGGDGVFTFSSADSSFNNLGLTTSGGVASSSVFTKTAGSYVVTENAQPGWNLVGLQCTGDTDSGSTFNVATRQATIDLDKGENLICTFTNSPTTPPAMTGTGVLTVTKTINWNSNTPDPTKVFSITITGPSYPNGHVDTITAGATNVYTNLSGGTYTVTETSPGAGWVTTYSVPSGAVNMVTPVAATTSGPISGNVFQDFNADGVDAGTSEPGVTGVTVTAYDPNGVVVGIATTTASGNYSFTPIKAGPYRVEFTNLPAGYEPTKHGTGNGTGTQFVTTNGGATNLNLGVNAPADYSQSNPNMIVPIYINGDTNATAPTGTLVKFAYNNSGTSPTPTTLATKAQVGSTWGLAYARSTKTLYAAAFLKRHVGLGPNGPGAIYAISVNGGTPTLFADLAALGANVGTVLSNSARGLGAPTSPSNDPSTYAQIGKVGLGDIDISDDESTLYVVNLNDKKIYALNVPAGTLTGSYAIPDPGCTGGAWRPFALKYKNGALYVGGVCDAQMSQAKNDLQAYVYRFIPGPNSFTQVLSVPLNYARGYISDSFQSCRGWYAWLDVLPSPCGVIVYPQPLLSDIEIDTDGSMILGLMDRTGNQVGFGNYGLTGTTTYFNYAGGDILRAYNNNGTYVLEANGTAGSITTGGANNGQGPGNGEFYYGDYFRNSVGTVESYETGLGGLALKPGSGELVSTAMDPFGPSTNGVYWFSNTTGDSTRRYRIYANQAEYFGKSNGVGDLELLADPAPLEIGNRVWNDLNGNGVQDPGEPGIAAVTVSLQGPTNTVTTNTDANGLYYFTVSPNTAYTITINPAQTPLNGLGLTQANMQAVSGNPSSNNALLDTRDSDAVTAGGKATIFYTTGIAGQNNHGLDFGWTQPQFTGSVTIGNTAPPIGTIIIRKATTLTGSSQSFSFTSNVPGHASFTLRDGDSYTMTEVPAGTYAVTETLPSGWTQAASTCTNVSTLGALQVTKDVTTTCSIINALQPTTSNVLTVTKIVNWNGNTPTGQTFNINLTGPSFPSGKADTITAGQTKVYTNVVTGVYTVTETSPGAGWVTTYSVPSGVVNLSGAPVAATTAGPISGNVFSDFNADGVDAGTSEPGVAGATVTAYDANGVARGSATTAATGNYSFTPTGSGPYRLELTNLPVGLYPTKHGSGNGTGTQFVTTNGGATNVNFGVNDPADYCQNNPTLCTPVLINGLRTSAGPTNALTRWLYNTSGSAVSAQTELGAKSEVGSLWGLAYDRDRDAMFAAAFMRRHVDIGPNGYGAIYRVSNANSATPGTPALFFDISTVPGITAGTVTGRDLGAYTAQSTDADAYTKVGKVAIGDIDLDLATRYLWVMALADAKLLAIPIDNPTPSAVQIFTLPDPGCTGGVARPFAIKPYRGNVYVGMVCDASTSQNRADLKALVYRFATPAPAGSGAGTWTQVLTFALNFTRDDPGTLGSCTIGGVEVTQRWNPWLDTYPALTCTGSGTVQYPEPMLTDIEFDVDGSMILGFADRFNYQVGYLNRMPDGTGSIQGVSAGDILRACGNATSGWTLESNGICGGVGGSGQANNGPGGGEFYGGDIARNGIHNETAQGGLAILPGSGEVASTFMDPVDVAQTAGVGFFSNATGAKTNGYQVFDPSAGYVGKTNGLGDLELLCNSAPLEIGNRVWNDLNGNGVQDPGEPGLANVTVSLQGPTNTVTTNTDANGLYYFTVSPNTAYTITINTAQTPLNGLGLTQANMQAISGNPSSNDALLDTRDSDGVTVGGKATIFYTTGSGGQNNHGLDFGWTQPNLAASVTITNTAPPIGSIIIRKATTPAGSSQSFSFTSNVPGHASFTLNDGGSYTMTDVPVGRYAVTETLPSGWTQASSSCTNVSTLGAIQVTKAVTTTCSILNALQPTLSNVLTVTKTVNWNGNTPNAGQTFNINITGPSFPSGKADTITAGQTKVYTNVVAGVYTVTETSPGAGWVTTYSVPSGVINLSTAAIVPTTAGPISGNVFRDYNADGVDAGTNEPGVAGVIVTAYDPNGAVSGSATTDANGNYSFTPTGSGPYRLELTNLPVGSYPTAHGTGNGTSTQFITTNGGASNVNFGVNDLLNYSQSNPDLVTPLYTNGDTNSTAPTGALVKFAYNSTGTSPTPTTVATKAQVGSTWGVAYARSTKTLYAAAFLKRHVGLGPNGLGAIYAVNINGGTPTLFADLAALGANVGTVLSNSARGLGAPTSPNNDATTYAQVGKVGLGDIDIADDERTLYVVSLNDKKLYALNVPAGTLAGSYTIPDPGCTGGAWRPFATKVKNGVVYVGGVCDAQTSQSKATLSATVYRFDPSANTFTSVLSFALNYPKGYAFNPCPALTGWYAWLDSLPATSCVNTPNGVAYVYPQPILSDIEFDVDGSMILGFMDRLGHQLGAANYAPTGTTSVGPAVGGDVLRACRIGSGYVLAGTSASCPNKSANNEGPGGGEYYYGDNLGTGHQENSVGGLALLPGSGEVAMTSMDPVSANSGGVTWLNNTSGDSARRYEVYNGNYPAFFAKANGLGDLELLADPAPIEIGNRVWNDLNGNGVQDPGEPGINGVQVSLQGPTNTATVNTTGDGNYYFGNLRANTAYTLTINPSQAPLSGLSLTQANMQAISGNPSSNDAFLDTRDSDGVTLNGKATIFYTTGSAGQNNHGLDFGWTQPLRGQVDITNKAPRMDLGDNPDRYNTVITNTGAAHVIVPGLFLGATEDDEDDGQPTADADGDGDDEDGVQFPTLKAGSTAIITVTTTNTGTQPAILAGWIDFNGNGQFEVSERVTTTVPAGTINGIFTLTYPVPTAAVSATYARFRLSTDPSVVNPTGVATDGEVEDYPISIEGITLVQFGDRVWLESDRDGLAASGMITPVVGMVITATNGIQTYTAQTNSQGYYSFTVNAGTYTVTYGSVPSSYGAVLPSSTPGGNRESGSAGSYRAAGKPDRSHGNGTTVTLTPGQANWQIDFAFHAPQVDLHLVKQVTPQVAHAGDIMTYTLVLTNNGPDPATGVQVQDRLPSTVTYQDATAQQGIYTANSGIWDIGTVAAGSSVTLTITVTLK